MFRDLDRMSKFRIQQMKSRLEPHHQQRMEACEIHRSSSVCKFHDR